MKLIRRTGVRTQELKIAVWIGSYRQFKRGKNRFLGHVAAGRRYTHTNRRKLGCLPTMHDR